MSERGPRLARRLIELCLDPASAEAAIGDLEEELVAERARLDLGTSLRYWREAISVCSRSVLARWRRPPGPNPARRFGLPAGAFEDARFALRLVRRRPLALLSAAASLGLGVALNAVVLAVLHAAWIQTIPYPEADRVVDLRASRGNRPDSRFGLSTADFVDWKVATTDVFSSFGAYVPFGTFDLTGDGEPIRLERDLATAGAFEALGVAPLLGRTFTEAEEEPGADRVVVLGHALWRSRFGGDPEILGRSLILDGTPHVVVGVMPRNFGVQGGTPDLWAPLSFGDHRPIDRRTYYLVGVARLREGVTFEQARSRLADSSREISREAADAADEELVVGLARPLSEVMTQTLRPLFTLLLGAVLLVLLMMALNVANLLTVLRLGRRNEVAVRRVLGASRLRLGRQTLIEGLVIALMGGLLGLLVSLAGTRLLPDLHGTFLHRFVDVQVNGWVIGLSLALSLATALVIGVLPSLAVPLRRLEGFQSSAGARVTGGRVSLGVVVLQTALCMLLLVAAGVTLRTVLRLQKIDMGYRHVETFAADLSLPASRYPSGEQAMAFQRRLLQQVELLPQVESVALANEVPGRGWGFNPSIPGRSEDPGVRARWLAVSADYFDTIGLELLEGRTFAELPAASGGGPGAAVLNREAARQLFGTESPIGERITLDGPDRALEIVGVVADVRRDVETQPGPAGYFLFDQVLRDISIEEVSLRTSVLLVRAGPGRVALDRLTADVGAALHAVDPLIPLTDPSTLKQRFERDLFRPRMSTGVLSLFGAIALALAALGLYGLISLAVRMRSKELAVRLALGARPRELALGVATRGLALTAAGIVGGLALSWALRQRLAGLVDGLAAMDWVAFVAAPSLLLVVGLLASWIPARRILGLDPVRSLREE